MDHFQTLGLALGLGLLIGLQRERTESRLGGIPTFPLICLLGTFTGLLADAHGAWVLAGGFVALAGLLAVSNLARPAGAPVEPGDEGPGQTTEIAALLTFALGAYLVNGNRSLAVVAAGVIVILLHLKAPMHRFVQAMGERDVRAVMQFVVISLIVLPLLPDQNYGPYGVLNPFDLWRMVVLIVGISLAGYVSYKILGERTGTLLGGALGGVIASTATTVAYARRSKTAPGAHVQAAFVIMAASTVAFVRVLVEITAVAPRQAGAMALPLTAMLVWMALIAIGIFAFYRGHKEELPSPENPAELKAALVFALLYGIILLAVAAARHH